METGVSKLNYEEPQVRADESIGWLITSKVPLYDEKGAVIGVLGTYQDITDRKRLEEQFRQAQKMEAFGKLAGGVAHDFNNLLTVIKGNVSLLSGFPLSKEERDAAISLIARAAERGANLTRQLLTFSRRQPLEQQALNLNDIVSDMSEMLHRLIGEDIQLVPDLSSEPSLVYADPGMMEQVILNLVINSRDAMPKGGRISIATSLVSFVEESAAEKPARRAGEFIRLTIADEGCGIEAGLLPHIFEPFYTTKEIGKGTGLGLATVFGIVEQHKGWIDVDSKVGKGTTLSVFLPRFTGDQTLQAKKQSGTPLSGGTESILLVEDEEAVRRMMKKMLTFYGYSVMEASSGKTALETWQTYKTDIDLIITDIIMPGGMTGRELAVSIMGDKPGIKVIYCSGYSSNILGAESTLGPNQFFLKKPFEFQELLALIRTALTQTH
jgi:signal transduction histidine kinase/ActR/RegA family two-component response regulator